MVDQEIFSRRLEALSDYLTKVKAFGKTTRDEFVATAPVHDLAERYLHLMTECVLDLANHTIAAEELGTPDTYRDSFLILRAADRLPKQERPRPAPCSRCYLLWIGYRSFSMNARFSSFTVPIPVTMPSSEISRASVTTHPEFSGNSSFRSVMPPAESHATARMLPPASSDQPAASPELLTATARPLPPASVGSASTCPSR